MTKRHPTSGQFIGSQSTPAPSGPPSTLVGMKLTGEATAVAAHPDKVLKK